MSESKAQEDVAETVAVEIFGVAYTLREDETADSDRIRVLADKVDRTMRDVARRLPDLDSSRIAVLAALNLANEASLPSAVGVGEKDGRLDLLVERVADLTLELEAALES